VRLLLSATGTSDHDDHDVFEYDFLPQTFSLQKSGQFLTTAQPGKPLEIAEKFFSGNSTSFGVAQNDLTYRITSSMISEQTGATHVFLQQTVNGLDVLNAVANINVASNGAVVSAYSSFVATMSTAAAASSNLSAAQALTSFVSYVGLDLSSGVSSTSYSSANVPASVIRFGDADVTLLSAPGVSRQAIPAQPVYIPVKTGLELGWRLNVQMDDGSHWFDAAVSAVDGGVKGIVDWVSGASYRVFVRPKESPSDGGRTYHVDPQNTVASPFGWHDTNGVAGAEFTTTQGNNVTAYTDTDANNVPDPGSLPDGGAGLVFDFPLMLATQQPADYRPAAVTNLFYWNNIVHDVLARNGFDEGSGNFQVTNYSGLGTGGDPVLAEAQDGSGTNNANFATPPEGTSPRMQMFRWTIAAPARDSDLDSGVIIHEYGHGLSNRLTGGPANSSALQTIQSGGMGEGWSDFLALMLTQKTMDSANAGRGIGTYVLGQDPTGAGIRTKKYSYDFSINNHTFADIIGSTSVHFVGETWATTLWDLNWALIEGNSLDSNLPKPGLGFNSNLYTGTGGNNLLLKLVIQGMKLQPANPSFLQARDAILQADLLLTGGANQATIWTVFARRGMGFSASDSGSSNTAVLPAFDVPLFTDIVFPNNLLPGSHVSRVKSSIAVPINAGETRTLRFFGENSSKISMTLTPKNAATILTVSIRRANGTLVYGPFTSGAAGQPVFISPSLLEINSNYRLEITSTLLSGVDIEAVRNAAIESQSGDSTTAAPVNLSSSFVNDGASRQAVIGNSSAGLASSRESAPASFIDISGTGTPLNLADDGSAVITTTVGNSLLPAGSVTVSNNGHVRPGAVSALSFSNVDLTAATTGLFPFWDDIDSDTGNVYWEQRSVGGINTLIIQWHNRPHYSNTGSATFQVQVFATGNTLVRFAYQDVVFENAAWDNGASATIGIVSPTGTVQQHSFNEINSVIDGDKIDFIAQSDIDDYVISANAGQQIDVIFKGLNNVDMTSAQVRLLQGSTVLATAVPKPLSSSVTAANYDLGIVGFVIPANGSYKIRVNSRVGGDYLTVITKNAVFDTENSNGALSPRRTIGVGINALGSLNISTDTTDQYALLLSAGQQVQIDLTRPFDSPLNTPVNTLSPRLQLRNSAGTLLASNTSSGPGGMPRITFTAITADEYRLSAIAMDGSGEYAVKVTTLTGGSLDQLVSTQTNKPVFIPALVNNTQSARPTFNWLPTDGAESYDIWINNITTATNAYLRQTVTVTEFVPSTDLALGRYQIYVQGIFPDGTRSPWSDPSTFEVRPKVQWITTNGSTTSQQPTITWTSMAGAARYDVWIDNRTTGTSQIIRNTSVTSTSFIPDSPLQQGAYGIWVRGFDVRGVPGEWSSVLQLNVALTPVTTRPASITVDSRPTFEWNNVPGANLYDLWVNNLTTGVSQTIRQPALATSQFIPSSSLPIGQYIWWVRAITTNASGPVVGPWSTGQTFTIGGAPVLLLQTSPQSGTPATLNWIPVAGAVSYSIWVDRIGGPSGIIQQTGIAATSFTPAAVLPQGNYRIWLRAVGSDGTLSSWSAPVTLTITSMEETPNADHGPLELTSVLDQEVPFALNDQTERVRNNRPALVQTVAVGDPEYRPVARAFPGMRIKSHVVVSGEMAIADHLNVFQAAHAGDELLTDDSADLVHLDFLLSQGDFEVFDN
jgi:extracellular elastinolytic metalloproteinase